MVRFGDASTPSDHDVFVFRTFRSSDGVPAVFLGQDSQKLDRLAASVCAYLTSSYVLGILD